MAQQVPAQIRNEFHGVYHAGNPATRPPFSAQVCENFRIMPGYWLRLRSGRKARYFVGANTQIKQLWAFRQLGLPGSDANIAQIKYPDGSVRWHWFSSLDFALDPFGGIMTIPQGNDGGYTSQALAGVCNVEDRPVLYNGYGLRGADSKPGLSSYADGIVRFWGLDAYCPSGRPTCGFTHGAGNNSIITGRVKIYVGLYNSAQNHYSNVVSAGGISPSPTTDTGTINVTGLGALTFASNNFSEESELKYVFYATIEDGQVPYLILNAALNGPFTVAVGSSSANLSLVSGAPNGWVLDLAHEAPTENYPPRRMKRISYVNGRMYGNLMSAGGTGFSSIGDIWERPFDYSSSARETAGMVWSKASGDTRNQDPLGDPLQCWPLTNQLPTPTGEQPIFHGPSPDEQSVLVMTSRATFLMTELADGLHKWFTVSPISGITNPATVAVTPRGTCWIDQKNQLVMLEPGATTLRILSLPYQALLTGVPNCANYILDPPAMIDKYQVWFADGHSVVHDFVTGEAYTETGPVMLAAGTITDTNNRRHHVIANSGFYTHEAQAEDGLIPTGDDTFTGTGQVKTTANFVGRARLNWDVMGSITVRKSLPHFDIMVDSHANGAFAVKLWKDFVPPIDGNKLTTSIVKSDQSNSDSVKRVKLLEHHFIALMAEFSLSSHFADRATYAALADEGNLTDNFYGSILLVSETVAPPVNSR